MSPHPFDPLTPEEISHVRAPEDHLAIQSMHLLFRSH